MNDAFSYIAQFLHQVMPPIAAALKQKALPMLGAAAMMSAIGGCAPGEAQDITVVWQLADGRLCVDTAVAKVQIELSDGKSANSIATGACHAHPGENQIPLHAVRPGMTLHGKGLSAQDAVLYRGGVPVSDPVPAVLNLTLYYTGGE